MKDWYLLYGGSSEDGRGYGKYIGRTTNKRIALKHLKEVLSSPYNTGSVELVTDTSCKVIRQLKDLE